MAKGGAGAKEWGAADLPDCEQVLQTSSHSSHSYWLTQLLLDWDRAILGMRKSKLSDLLPTASGVQVNSAVRAGQTGDV